MQGSVTCKTGSICSEQRRGTKERIQFCFSVYLWVHWFSLFILNQKLCALLLSQLCAQVKICTMWNPFSECWWLIRCKCISNKNWRALCKRNVCRHFAAVVQVAQNPLKFAVPTLFVWKGPYVFSLARRKIWTNQHENPPPSPTPPCTAPPPTRSLSLQTM